MYKLNRDKTRTALLNFLESQEKRLIYSLIFCLLLFFFTLLTGDDTDVVKVSVKSPWGKQVVRRFHKTDLIRNIFSFANSLCLEKEETSGRNFDICTAYPSRSLIHHLDMTILEAGVSGSQVIMRWITE